MKNKDFSPFIWIGKMLQRTTKDMDKADEGPFDPLAA
jgi:hypothetical protein